MGNVTKFGAGLGVLAYALGVAAVSFYLWHNDIPDPDLSVFKGHYIYTGIVLIGFLALPTVLVYVCSTAKDGWGDQSVWVLVPVVVLVLTLGCCLIWLSYHLILRTRPGVVDNSDTTVPLELLAISILAAVLGVAAYLAFNSGEGAITRATTSLLVVLTTAVTIWFISLFSVHIYPVLPNQFGGGKPTQARILFSRQGAAEAQQLGIPVQSGELISSPVTILLAGDSFYAVRNPLGKVVQISKESVNGLQEDSKSPRAIDVQTRDHGKIVGLPETGDALILTFSEEMAPASLIPDWDGDPTDARIVMVRTSQGSDEIRFRSADNKARLEHLGEIDIHRGRYHRFFGRTGYAVSIVEKGPRVVVTLDEGAAKTRHPVRQSETMVWRPSPEAVDDVGNYSYATPVNESNGSPHPDIDF